MTSFLDYYITHYSKLGVQTKFDSTLVSKILLLSDGICHQAQFLIQWTMIMLGANTMRASGATQLMLNSS